MNTLDLVIVWPLSISIRISFETSSSTNTELATAIISVSQNESILSVSALVSLTAVTLVPPPSKAVPVIVSIVPR